MKTTLRNVLIFFAIVLFLVALWYFRNIVVYILVSGVLSIMGRPLVDLFCRLRIRNWKFPRVLSALLTLVLIWGVIILFFVIFIPLVTQQINYLSTIDSERIVQLAEDPINKLENLFRSFNQDIDDDISIKEYIVNKVSGILNINMIQNFLGSLIGILGNIVVAVFSISF